MSRYSKLISQLVNYLKCRERRSPLPPRRQVTVASEDEDEIYHDAEPDTESEEEVDIPPGMYLDPEPFSDVSAD